MSAAEGFAQRSEEVRRAHQVIENAWVTGRPYDLASQAAFALESAQLLQSPETAAEHERLRARVAELEHPAEDLTATWSQYLDTTGTGARLACTDSLGRDVWLEVDEGDRHYLHEHLAPREEERADHAYGDEECPGCGLIALEGTHDGTCGVAADEKLPPFAAEPGLTVYQASHDALVMGLYTTAAAAREHCEECVRQEAGDPMLKGCCWVPDDHGGVDQDPVEELCFRGTGLPTGYVVTPLTVASAYDAEADE